VDLNKRDITLRLINNDAVALKVIHDQYYNRFIYIANGFIKSRQDAEEVVQDVFIKLWKNRANLNSHITFEGYLFVSLKRAVWNRIRDLASRNKNFQALSDLYVAENRTDDHLIYDELSTRISKIVDEFPPQRKQIFQLRKLEGLSNKEVAERLEISVKMVEKQMTIALKGLKKSLLSNNELLIFLLLFYSL
jgi:RNA polymerase sigma-70 factor, ECF subfamily